jgi:FAD/FMN-containing dehydrogenase
VKCANEQDVARAVELARTHGLEVAVRSGGHSQAGHSVCDRGVVIDVAPLKGVAVQTATRVARAGAGLRVSELLAALGPSGMVTPMGGCPDVGIGGLTLGGGESFLTARFGAVCDNVIGARVVTAAGRVLTTSADEHPDLYWAIRGGGGNFGIVTTFEYRLHPLDRVLAGLMFFPVSRTRDVVRRYRDLMMRAPDDLQTSGGLLSSTGEPQLFIALCHCGGRAEAERLVGEWRAALRPAEDTIAAGPYAADFVLPASPSVGDGAFLPELNDAVVDVLAAQFSAAPPSCTAAWNDFHGAVTRVPVDAMAFPLRAPGYDLFVHAMWKTAGDREASVAWLDRFREALRPWSRGVYINNLGEDSDARTREAYGANYARLAAIKATYDPDNAFHHNHNIRPARPGAGGSAPIGSP